MPQAFKILLGPKIGTGEKIPLASWLWTKEQLEDKSKMGELTKRQVQFGISFNLDKALGWVK